MNLLVCGGAGFIGSHFVELALESGRFKSVVVLDALTYAGRPENLPAGVKLVHAPIQDAAAVDQAIQDHNIHQIVNFAAESHNDRSLLDAGSFIQTDVYGVYVLLEAVRRHGIERFVHVSTDEVYGSVATGEFNEDSPLQPNTPYSASKAGGDLQIRAHVKAFKTPSMITRGGNTYGPRQYPEKLIPFFAVRLLTGKKVPLYGDGSQVREWIHVRDHAAGILAVLENGQPGNIYNIGDQNERTNREIVEILLRETGRGEDFIKQIEDPRKGAHDQRYSMTCRPALQLGWSPQQPFAEALARTIQWYREHPEWWEPILADQSYQEFIAKYYGPYLGEDL